MAEKAADNAARYQAAVDSLGVFKLEGDPIDPAYQTVPISQFVPHRPARPEKSEGGKKFKLVSDYVPAGDQPTAIQNWWPASTPMSATRCCWASPARARPSPWPR